MIRNKTIVDKNSIKVDVLKSGIILVFLFVAYWSRCPWALGKNGQSKASRFIGKQDNEFFCKHACVEYRLFLFPAIDGVSYTKSNKNCFCLIGQTGKVDKSGTRNCKLDKERRRKYF